MVRPDSFGPNGAWLAGDKVVAAVNAAPSLQ